MTLSVRATVDTLRTLAEASISSSYTAVGTPFLYPVRLICFTNNTDGDMLWSSDGVNNMLFTAASSFKLFDVSTNRQVASQILNFPQGMQWYVKESTAPTKGAVYIEIIYALPQNPVPNTL